MYRSTRSLRKRLFSTGIVALFCALTPATLLAQDKQDGSDQGGFEPPGRYGVYMVSGDLFDVLEDWSGETPGYEKIVLDAYPEAIQSYVETVRALYQGLTLGEHFDHHYPEAAKEYVRATEGEITDDADFIAYVMGHRQTDYRRWQGETALRGGGTFHEYVTQYHPEVVAQAAFENVTPAQKGISLDTYIRGLGREDLAEEIGVILDPPGMPPPPPGDCECWVVITTDSNPFNTETTVITDIDKEEGWLPKKTTKVKHTITAMGVAKDIELDRLTKHVLYEGDDTHADNWSEFRVRMHCTEGGVAGGVQCEGAACVGELALIVEYASRVREDVNVKKIWSKRARALAADTAFLRYDPPGPVGEMILFEKGVGVSGDTKTGWNVDGIVQSIVAGTELVTSIIEDGAGGIEEDLVEEFLEGLFVLTTREGDPGHHSESMYVRFDTANSVPFPLTPNTTHVFLLDTLAHVYTRGYGGESKTSSTVNSSKYLAGVARNFQCSGGAKAPTPGGCWLWGTEGGPHSEDTLQNRVHNYIHSALGTPPQGTSMKRGCFPPQ